MPHPFFRSRLFLSQIIITKWQTSMHENIVWGNESTVSSNIDENLYKKYELV